MMTVYLIGILSFFISTSLQAQDADQVLCKTQDSQNISLLNNDLLENIEGIIECPTDKEIVLKKVTEDFNKYYGNKKQYKKYVKGYLLKGTSRELSLANKMLGSKPPKDWKNAASNCDTVQCAFSKLLKSDKASMQLFNFKEKSGYYLSLDQKINQNMGNQIWSAKEIQELDAAVDKFPPQLKGLKLKKIDRLADGLRAHGHGSNVAAYASTAPELVIYDSGAKGAPTGKNSYKSTSWPQEVLAHEMCHHHDHKGVYAHGTMISEQRNSIFKKISGWKEKTNRKGEVSWVSSSGARFVSNYASSQPAEDYAESCMNYLLHPGKLQKKAPKKYEYMKKYVFKGSEFKKSPWVKTGSPKWPELTALVNDQKDCAKKIGKCLTGFKYIYEKFCDKSSIITNKNSTHYRCSSAKKEIQKSSCVKDVKKEKLIEIKALLVRTDPLFCKKGGDGLIDTKRNDLCEKSIDLISKSLNDITKLDLSDIVGSCEIENDYTKDCILQKVLSDSGLDNNYIGIISSVLDKKIPDRMTALGKNIGKRNSSEWFKSCLKSINKISHFRSKSSGEKDFKDLFSYNDIDENVSPSYLGRYIYNNYKSNDVNMSCAKNSLESLEHSGVKIPKSGSPVNLMSKEFKNEISSFENEVLVKIPDNTKKCLIFKKCKIKAILKLLKDWENRSLESRKGFATAEYAEEIYLKTKVDLY